MKNFFIILFVSIAAIVIGGCLNLASIFPIPNVAPVIISEPIITATEDQLYSYQVEASDYNGDILTYSFIIMPEGMNINSENGLITWTPTNDQVGINQVEVEIYDGKYNVQQKFEIEVCNVNNPPKINTYSPTNLNFNINEGDSIRFNIQATDLDLNTILNYQWFLNGNLVSNSFSKKTLNNSENIWQYFSQYGDYGIKIIKVVVSDGELEDYIQWKINISDTTPPNNPTINEVSSPTNISTQILSGNKEENTSIWINGTEVITINSSTNWSYSYSLAEGNNSISITSRDVSNNESVAVTANIVLDSISPETPTLNAVTSPTNISPQILLGNKEKNSSIWVNGVEVVPINPDNIWSYLFDLSEGINNISITSLDAVGNESSEIKYIIILDTNTPKILTFNTVTSPTNISSQTLSGTKEPNTSIWINGIKAIAINSSTSWTYNYNLSEGENNISITSQDSAGNESGEATVKIILDTISPMIPTLNSIISPTNILTQILRGTKEANSSILINSTEIISLNSSIDWSYSYNLIEGNNNISITSRDIAGNESTAVTTTIDYDPNIYVDVANTTGVEDGTQTHPFDTIAEGIDAVALGKSVVVSAGIYNEQLIINKGITLQGAGVQFEFEVGIEVEDEFTLISGLDCAGGNLITITTDNVTISGFVIDGEGHTYVGIYSDSFSSIEISENLIQNHRDSGILYYRASDDYPSGIYVYNNEICYNYLNGIKVTGEGSGIIENNTIRKNTNGIRTNNSASLEIKHNNINDNTSAGIICQDSSFLLIWGNEITINDYGIKVGVLSSDTTNPDIGGGTKDGVGQNKIAGNKTHGVSNKTTYNIMAKNNWWGDAAGPKYPYHTLSSGDWAYWSETGGNITFDPYLTTEP